MDPVSIIKTIEAIMTDFILPTMTCGACEKRVRKALSAIEGVGEVSIDLTTRKVSISGTAPHNVLTAALTGAGYRPAEN
jgi:copper chaperone CopZ